jgi:hypothetical protein
MPATIDRSVPPLTGFSWTGQKTFSSQYSGLSAFDSLPTRFHVALSQQRSIVIFVSDSAKDRKDRA